MFRRIVTRYSIPVKSSEKILTERNLKLCTSKNKVWSLSIEQVSKKQHADHLLQKLVDELPDNGEHYVGIKLSGFFSPNSKINWWDLSVPICSDWKRLCIQITALKEKKIPVIVDAEQSMDFHVRGRLLQEQFNKDGSWVYNSIQGSRPDALEIMKFEQNLAKEYGYQSAWKISGSAYKGDWRLPTYQQIVDQIYQLCMQANEGGPKHILASHNPFLQRCIPVNFQLAYLKGFSNKSKCPETDLEYLAIAPPTLLIPYLIRRLIQKGQFIHHLAPQMSIKKDVGQYDR